MSGVQTIKANAGHSYAVAHMKFLHMRSSDPTSQMLHQGKAPRAPRCGGRCATGPTLSPACAASWASTTTARLAVLAARAPDTGPTAVRFPAHRPS